MRLRSKLLLGSSVLALSIWPVAWYAEQTSSQALDQVLVERASRQANDVLDETLRLGRDRLRELQVLAQQPVFQRHLIASNLAFEELADPHAHVARVDEEWRATPAGERPAAMKPLLDNECGQMLRAYLEAVDHQHGYPVYGELFVTNRYGANVGQSGRTSDYRQDDEEWWQLARRNGIHISGAQFDESAGIVSTDICVRVTDKQGALLGVLKAVLDVRGVTQILDNHAFGSEARFVLLDPRGGVLHDTSNQALDLPDVTAFDAAPPGERGVRVRRRLRSGDDTDVVSALATRPLTPSSTIDWHILADFPSAGVLAPARQIGERIRWVAWIVTLLGSAVGLIFSLSIARRVDILRTATSRIRDGELESRVPDEHNDELGELAASFNEMAAELELAQRGAEAARAAKDAFLANMSHEIRTPMAAIVGAVDLLVTPHLDENERIEHFQSIRTSSQHLLSLINGILDLSKIEAGKLTVEEIECSPALIAQEVIELLSHEAIAKKLALSFEFASPVPASVMSDPTRIRQILVNLVGNAIKFTPTGHVRIALSFDDDGATVRFRVIDSGVGIDAEKLDKVFRPFEQADMSTSRLFGGTGLGLTISRELARALGGDLSAESTGRGSTFTLTIAPRQIDTSRMIESVDEILARSTAAGPQGELWDLTGTRVLLAEDVVVNRRLMAKMLTMAGVEVTLAENGREALAAVQAARAAGETFDVILMDLMMPELDGWGATQRLRGDGYSRPIVAFTADAMRETSERCLRAGFNAVVTKPVRRAELLDAIAAQVTHGRERRESA